jgi:cell division protein FtsL
VFNHPDSEIINSINLVSNNYINNDIFHMEQQIEAKKKEIEELQKKIEKNLVV